MKKLRVALTSVLLGVLVFVLASCGGAGGVVSSYASAVKKGDYEKAATYVVGKPSLSNSQEKTGEVYDYIYSESAKSFKLKVEETTENKDSEENVTSYTVKISYTKDFSATAVALEYAGKALTGSEATKATAKEIMKDAKEVSGDMTVVVVVKDGEKLMEAASATALLAVIRG